MLWLSFKRSVTVSRRRKRDLGNKRSGFEVTTAAILDANDVDYEYESLVFTYTESLRKNLAECAACGSKDLLRTGRYTPDFVLASGIIIETKGRFDAKDRRKMLAVRDEYTDYRFVMLFMRDNRISRRSNTYYSDWCMTNQYEFAIGEPLKEWFT